MSIKVSISFLGSLSLIIMSRYILMIWLRGYF